MSLEDIEDMYAVQSNDLKKDNDDSKKFAVIEKKPKESI